MKHHGKLTAYAVRLFVALVVSGLVALAWVKLTTHGGNDDQTPLLTIRHDSVTGAIWNHDETQLMTRSYSDGAVRIWNAQTGDELLTLHHYDQSYQITSAAWNPDETLILTSSADSFVRLWDTKTGELLLMLDHSGWVNGAAWSQDGTHFLSWSYTDGSVRVWAVQHTDKELTATEQLNMQHQAIGAAWNGDETRILSRSPDGTLTVWDADTGDALVTFQHEDVVDGAVWSRNGGRILSWTGHRTIHIWDVETGTERLKLRHEAPPGSDLCCALLKVIWNESETRILSHSEHDNNVCVWDAATGNLLFTLQADKEDAFGTAYSPPWNPDRTMIVLPDGSVVFYTDSSHVLCIPGLVPDNVVWNQNKTRVLVMSHDEIAIYAFEHPAGWYLPATTLTG